MTHPSATRLALTLFLWLPSMALAQAQQFEGLDLTDPVEKPDDQNNDKNEDANAEVSTEPTEAESAPAADVENVAAGSAETAAQAQRNSGALERDITQDDRVKSVHRKVYLKKGRFELAPSVSTTVNDPYYAKFGFSGRLAYYLADTLAISGRFTWIELSQSQDSKIAKGTFRSRIFYSDPQWSAMGDVEWSPIYGKVSIFNSILHFDAYVLTGLGVVFTETSKLEGRGPHIGADLGIGIRFVARDFLAINASLINTTYVDQPAGTIKGSTQNMLALGLGVSLFLPFRSTGREGD